MPRQQVKNQMSQDNLIPSFFSLPTMCQRKTRFCGRHFCSAPFSLKWSSSIAFLWQARIYFLDSQIVLTFLKQNEHAIKRYSVVI